MSCLEIDVFNCYTVWVRALVVGVTVLVGNYPAESQGCSPVHAQSEMEQPWGSDRRNTSGVPPWHFWSLICICSGDLSPRTGFQG